jgi:hypothetical protein
VLQEWLRVRALVEERKQGGEPLIEGNVRNRGSISERMCERSFEPRTAAKRF